MKIKALHNPILLILGLLLISQFVFTYFKTLSKNNFGQNDDIELLNNQYEKIKPLIGSDSILGYSIGKEMTFSELRKFYQLRYMLSPIILDNKTPTKHSKIIYISLEDKNNDQLQLLFSKGYKAELKTDQLYLLIK